MDLLARAAQAGVLTSFVDAAGQHRQIDTSALELLLNCIPDAPSHPFLDASITARDSQPAKVEVSSSAKMPVGWQIEADNRAVVAEGMSSERRLALPSVSPGVFRLRVHDASSAEDERPLVVSPGAAFSGDFARVWILAIQLYGIRSLRNWGIGDFTDLEALIAWAAKAGAAGIGLNPLHVLFQDHPQDCSPYSPNSRLFLNPLYIDVPRLPELPAEFAQKHADAIEELRAANLVDYVGVAALKIKALRLAFAAFKARTTLKRKTSFDEFRKQNPLLSRFACFEILRRKMPGPWWEWPAGWSRPDDKALAGLRDGPDKLDIEFVEFVQWCADQQLKACSDLAHRMKMPIGLYLDVAVGVKADGFDAWNEQVAISRRLSVGAPPDLLNTAGQDWGLAGFNSTGLQMRLFAPFREMIRASMRYAGAIRLDHVLGLNRIYLVPNGFLPGNGAYAEMPFESLLAVASLESVENRCIVIGEDLGTVPDGFREKLAEWGIWSYRVMMFERDHDGAFHPIEYYPQNSLVTFNTHDLPTFSGWHSGHDIDLKHSLGIDPGESRDSRAYAALKLTHSLNHAELGDPTFYAVLSFLSRTKSRLLAVSIEDLLGVVDQPNIPGTIDEHPNWRQRLPYPVEKWEDHIDVEKLRAALADRSMATDAQSMVSQDA